MITTKLKDRNRGSKDWNGSIELKENGDDDQIIIERLEYYLRQQSLKKNPSWFQWVMW